jgi:hypothetical protein
MSTPRTGRQCTVCVHDERAAIDRALVEGTPTRSVADQYGLSKTAVHRHQERHLPAHMVQAREAAETVAADSLLERLRELNRETQDVLRAARKEKDHELRLKAIARAEKQLELEARLLGELKDGATVNILVNPQWVEVRATILRALDAHPAARLAVAEALSRADA